MCGTKERLLSGVVQAERLWLLHELLEQLFLGGSEDDGRLPTETLPKVCRQIWVAMSEDRSKEKAYEPKKKRRGVSVHFFLV